MNKLSIARFGFAVAVACAVSYLGCVFVMMTVPQEVAIRFFNSLMHGVDVTTIMRWDMPLWETVLGVIEIFVLGWLFGALIAGCYNCCGKSLT
ncbi:hypothetical protein Mal15_55830 [Stieleria maiorica]|uniref:Uncharacterized protein n=1 Tax=Stieleria maiorica TaxID=2795974 RepID=A0A5B9MPB6_9BACT|nr:DUF5676 family membrane protein [Stieleria maiorica]QEG01506.1 hypothetical protein Mal15_55830 [Stieleria maiorica]